MNDEKAAEEQKAAAEDMKNSILSQVLTQAARARRTLSKIKSYIMH